jgi:hypothetical protein
MNSIDQAAARKTAAEKIRAEMWPEEEKRRSARDDESRTRFGKTPPNPNRGRAEREWVAETSRLEAAYNNALQERIAQEVYFPEVRIPGDLRELWAEFTLGEKGFAQPREKNPGWALLALLAAGEQLGLGVTKVIHEPSPAQFSGERPEDAAYHLTSVGDRSSWLRWYEAPESFWSLAGIQREIAESIGARWAIKSLQTGGEAADFIRSSRLDRLVAREAAGFEFIW